MSKSSIKVLLIAVIVCYGLAQIDTKQFVPNSVSCYKFLNAANLGPSKCISSHIFWRELCEYQCNDSGAIKYNNCSAKVHDINDYAKCDDLFCQLANEDAEEVSSGDGVSIAIK